jgi:hypothetical protein
MMGPRTTVFGGGHSDNLAISCRSAANLQLNGRFRPRADIQT